MIAESGLQRDSEGSFETFESVLNNNAGNAGPSSSGSAFANVARRSARDTTSSEVEEPLEELEDVKLLNTKIVETDTELKKSPNDGTRQSIKNIKNLLERKEDLMRLKRVEQIYVRISIDCILESSLKPLIECCPPSATELGFGTAEASVSHCLGKQC